MQANSFASAKKEAAGSRTDVVSSGGYIRRNPRQAPLPVAFVQSPHRCSKWPKPVVGPLMLGHVTTFHEGAFTVESTVRIIADRTITNLAAAPTAYRLLMAAGTKAMALVFRRSQGGLAGMLVQSCHAQLC